jgi:ribosomal protein S18 acetylase RimI-like enzyme
MGTVLQTVDIMDLRHFGSQELRPLLQAETAAWARSMSWDYHSSAEMILRYIDSKILPGYVALDDRRPCGYAFFVYEGSKGVIGDVYVEPRADEAQLKSSLVSHVIETLQQTPGVNRIEAQLLIQDSGAVAAPFTEQGFRRFDRLFMELPIDRISGESELHGYSIRKWTEGDFQPAAGVITAAYAMHIDSQINDQYRTVTGSLRFLNNIVRFPGCGVFDANSSFVITHPYTGAMLALLLCSRVREDVAHVTQICVLPEHRGRGLGEALIRACCIGLRERGSSRLTLTVTGANTNAVELYHRLGFETGRIFDAFVWEG